MIKVNLLFFASFRELLGCSHIELNIELGSSIEDICTLLAAKGEPWVEIFSNPAHKVKVAVNQSMAEFTDQIHAEDEIAFFPPVTGG